MPVQKKLRLNGFCVVTSRSWGKETVAGDKELSKVKWESIGAGAGTQDSEV